MDPVGPWSAYASYNRLAGVQAGAAGGDFHHHLAGSGSTLAGHNAPGGVPSTTSQLLLQAAHTTASLAGQLSSSTAPFNPGGFLSPPPVAYDAVFSPLFHHTNPKPAHYSSTINAQHRQALVQAQAAAASKQASVESELSTLRENYTSHHQSLAAAQGSTFFDQSAAAGSASGLAWQGNNQLPSPFGILPHESVVPSSPSPAATKSSSSAAYENFNVFAAAQINNHISSQLAANANKTVRSASPQVTQPVKPVPSQASASVPAGTFFQTSATFGNPTENISSYSTSNAKSGPISTQQDYATSGKQRANSTAPTPPAASHQSPASSISSPQDITPKVPDKKMTVPVSSGSSFMASYLKFLQGERDTSPPPATRGGRKASWSRTNNANNKTYNDQINSKIADHQNLQTSQNSNGTLTSSGTSNTSVAMNTASVLSPVGNMNSAGNIVNPGSLNAVNVMSPGNIMPSMPTVAKTIDGSDDSRYFSVPKDRKRKFDGLDDGFDANDDEARRINKPVLNVPSTPLNEKGKKGRTNVNKTPTVVASPQGSNGPKKPRPAVQPSLPVMQAQSHQQYYYQQPDEVAAHGAGIDYADYSSEDENAAKKLNQQRTLHQSSIIQQTTNNRCEEMPYQSGEFVAVKSELSESWPAIWRVDGKALLQKFEPFDQNGKILYRNISTYAAWNPDSKKLYIQVPVRVRAQNHLDTIVELMRNEFSIDDNDFIEKRMQDTATYQDNFEVYIQTLISHALDPNFLTEIFQEQDEYFLSNVKTVDDITEERRRRVIGAGVMWSRGLEAALNTWPCLNNTELSISAISICSVCRLSRATQRIQLYGQPYNPSTLEPRQPDPRVAYEKESVMCRLCANRIELFSRISHQKYLMFIECNKRVSEKRLQDPHKDTTLILNELLADEPWLSQLFREVRQSWTEAESIERKYRQATPSRQLI